MTSSRDSLIPDVPDKSEAQAKCDAARKHARHVRWQALKIFESEARADYLEKSLDQTIDILSGGKS